MKVTFVSVSKVLEWTNAKVHVWNEWLAVILEILFSVPKVKKCFEPQLTLQIVK